MIVGMLNDDTLRSIGIEYIYYFAFSLRTEIYRVAQKNAHYTLVHIFAKY